MFKTMFRPIVTVILLVLLVPTVAIGSEISGRLDEVKTVGGLAVAVLVCLLLVVLLILGGGHPKLAMAFLGGGGVMVAAVAWLFPGWYQMLLFLGMAFMFGLCVWAGITVTEMTTDESKRLSQNVFL